MPRFGAARTFVIVDLDHSGTLPSAYTRLTWDPASAVELPAWLKRQHVVGILCGGIHPRFQIAIEAENLWVAWGFRGEISEVLKLWLDAGRPFHAFDHHDGFVSCCRQSQPADRKSAAKPNCTRRKQP